MSFVLYFFVLLVAAGSVLFGLDWLQAPLPPMPPGPSTVVAGKPANTAPARQAAANQAVRQIAKPPAPVAAAATKPSGPDTTNATMTPVADTAVAGTDTAPKCDIAACASAYRSFRASDCTYQPYDGPRRLCARGKPPEPDRTAAAQAAEAHAQASCNVDACQRAYISFSAADCTYQPNNGPRRLCEK